MVIYQQKVNKYQLETIEMYLRYSFPKSLETVSRGTEHNEVPIDNLWS
jgi:hypothetical protein